MLNSGWKCSLHFQDINDVWNPKDSLQWKQAKGRTGDYLERAGWTDTLWVLLVHQTGSVVLTKDIWPFCLSPMEFLNQWENLVFPSHSWLTTWGSSPPSPGDAPPLRGQCVSQHPKLDVTMEMLMYVMDPRIQLYHHFIHSGFVRQKPQSFWLKNVFFIKNAQPYMNPY